MIVKFYPTNSPSTFESYTVPYTVIVNSFLDEELDSTSFELVKIAREEPFTPFTIASMHPTENETIYWMVAADTSVKDIGTGLYTHTVTLIEPTKWLERWMVGNKTITQHMAKKYNVTMTVDAETPNGSDQLTFASPSYEYVSPIIDTETIKLYNVSCFNEPVVRYPNPSTLSMRFNTSVTANGVKIYEEKKTYSTAGGLPSAASSEFDVSSYTGMISVEYSFVWYYSAGGTPMNSTFGAIYNVARVSSASFDNIKKSTAAKHMIVAAQSLNESQESLFDLDLSSIPDEDCPELTVTNATLREALDEIGKTFGAISRLDISVENGAFKYTISFEKFCKEIEGVLPESPGEVILSQSCEDYCTTFDATVENIIQYSYGGSIVDPSTIANPSIDPSRGGFFKTLRTESASYRITEDSCEVLTSFPIERLDKVEISISLLDAENAAYQGVKDITAYCFEASEYGILSSYNGTYPYSKAYALKYSIGGKSISELNFTVPNAVSALLTKPAIVNIVNTVYGLTGSDKFNNLNELDFTKLLFRVTYVPTGAARIRMRKPTSFRQNESSLPFNQSSAKIDSQAFGRNMFGALIRMGNAQKTLTYILPLDYDLPERGSRIGDNGYLAEIKTEYAPAYKKVSLTVIEGFNRLSAFIGVNQSLRLFEISERMSIDRHIVYEDMCVIGSSMTSGGKALLTIPAPAERRQRTFVDAVSYPFIAPRGDGIEKRRVQAIAMAQGFVGSTALQKVFLPCTSYGIGNALVFTFSYEDNYSAGKRVDPASYVNEAFKTQTDVPYADSFGRIDTLSLRLIQSFEGGDVDVEQIANALPADPGFVLPFTYADLVTTEGNIDDQTSRRLVINKDSRERLASVTYQLNFLSKDGIIIGPNITKDTRFTYPDSIFVLVSCQKPLNSLTNIIDVPQSIDDLFYPSLAWDRAGIGFSLSYNTDGNNISRSTFTQDGKAWAIVDSATGEFILGKNEVITTGETPLPTIYFSFIH